MSETVEFVKPDTLRDAAKSLAKRGFKVFPLIPGEKTPSVMEFFTKATTDLGAVERMWSEAVTNAPAQNNIGILCGEGMFVLDVDTKNGSDGLNSLEFYTDIGLDTNTLTASTPSGGRHLFYRIPDGVYVGNSVKKIGDGLDVIRNVDTLTGIFDNQQTITESTQTKSNSGL